MKNKIQVLKSIGQKIIVNPLLVISAYNFRQNLIREKRQKVVNIFENKNNKKNDKIINDLTIDYKNIKNLENLNKEKEEQDKDMAFKTLIESKY